MRHRGWRVGLVLFLVAMGPPGLARAEPYVGAYLGATFPLDAKITDNTVSPLSASGVSVDESAVFGGKFGLWSDTVRWLGIELDISGYKADIPGQVASGVTVFATDMEITASGFHLLARIPLGPPEGDPMRRAYFYLGVAPRSWGWRWRGAASVTMWSRSACTRWRGSRSSSPPTSPSSPSTSSPTPRSPSTSRAGPRTSS